MDKSKARGDRDQSRGGKKKGQNPVNSSKKARSSDASRGSQKPHHGHGHRQVEENRPKAQADKEAAEKQAKEDAERKARDAEEALARELQAQLAAQSLLQEAQKEIAAKAELRAQNSADNIANLRQQAGSGKAKLKSDLKKSQAFIRKVKGLVDNKCNELLKDIQTLNLRLYVSEVVVAIAELGFKISDIGCAVKVCSAMHQRYPDFLPELVKALLVFFQPAGGAGEGMQVTAAAEEDKDLVKKRKVALRLLLELMAVGAIEDTSLAVKLTRMVVGQMKSERHSEVATRPGRVLGIDVGLLVVLVRYSGEEYLGITPRKMQQTLAATGGAVADLQHHCPISDQAQEVMLQLVEKAYHSLAAELLSKHRSLHKLEWRFEEDRLTMGSLTEEKGRKLEEARKFYEKLSSNMKTLADSLDKKLPDLPSFEEADKEEIGISLWVDGSATDSGPNTGPFDDEDTRSFYEDLLDLLVMVPPALLGLTEEEVEKLKAESKKPDDNEEIDEGEDTSFENKEDSAETNKPPSHEATEVSVEDDSEEATLNADEDQETKELEAFIDKGDSANADEEPESKGPQFQLNLLLEEELPQCHNRDRTDDFAVKFCSYNSKGARKKLVKAIFSVPRQALDLLPQYARLVATLSRVMKDIAQPLVTELMSEFRWLQRKKSQHNIETKMKNVRFIGELVKFRAAPPAIAYNVLKACLDDFTHHNIDVACGLLETCGWFLYRLKHTHKRTANFLDTLMRLKKAKSLDQRANTLIDNAYYTCKPPERAPKKVKEYTPLQQWIRHLLFDKLEENTVELVLKQLRKLPWYDEEEKVEEYILKCALKVTKTRFENLQSICDVIAGLNKYHDTLSIRLVDAILEDLQRGLETFGQEQKNNVRILQRQLCLTKLLGELYNYSLVNSPVIFNALYNILNFGHEVPDYLKQPQPKPDGSEPLPPPVAEHATHDPRVFTPVDLPTDTFRIRLVCMTLSTCGSYFCGGPSRLRLARFLAFFQRYIFCKPYLPSHVDFDVLDLWEFLESEAKAAAIKQAKKLSKAGKSTKSVNTVGPFFERFASWEEAHAACVAIEAKDHEIKQRVLKKKVEREGGSLASPGISETMESLDIEDEDDDIMDLEEDPQEHSDEERSMVGEDTAEERDHSDDSDDEEEDSINENRIESEEDDVIFRRHNQEEKTEDDLLFEKAFSQMVQESMEKTKLNRGVGNDSVISIPMSMRNMPVQESSGKALFTGEPGVKFKMLRKGNKGKVEGICLQIPTDTNLVEKVERNRAKEIEDNKKLKERVLQLDAEMGDNEEPLLIVQNKPARTSRQVAEAEADEHSWASSTLRPGGHKQYGHSPSSGKGGHGGHHHHQGSSHSTYSKRSRGRRR